MAPDFQFTQFHSASGIPVYRLPLEAFPGFWVWAYLVQVGSENYLIDTGSGVESSNADLVRGFEQAGIELQELSCILLTHSHIDHYGGLPFLRQRTRARFGVHELDAATVSQHEARLGIIGRRLDSFLATAGIDEAKKGELLGMYRFTKSLYRSVPLDFTYEDGGMREGPFEFVHLPGHCPGHVAIKLEDILFCGDILLAGITPHQSPEELAPFLGVSHFLDSLAVLERWGQGVRLVLNGHDEVIEDFPSSAGNVRANLSRRISQTLEAFSQARTIAEATGVVYGQREGYNALLVLEKVGAYAEYLYQRGLLEIVNQEEIADGLRPVPIRYRSLNKASDVEILPKERTHVFV